MRFCLALPGQGLGLLRMCPSVSHPQAQLLQQVFFGRAVRTDVFWEALRKPQVPGITLHDHSSSSPCVRSLFPFVCLLLGTGAFLWASERKEQVSN